MREKGAGPNAQRVRRRFGRVIGAVSLLAAFSILAVHCSGLQQTGSDSPRVARTEWTEPLWPGIPTVSDACTVGVCVGGNVILPLRRPVETATDMAVPDTLGALSVERVWTGQRGGLFGPGWESVWDVHLSNGRLVGPVPARPVEEPRPHHTVGLEDGSSLHLNGSGRVDEVCLDGSYCVQAERTRSTINLRAQVDSEPGPEGNAPLVMILDGERVTSVIYQGQVVQYRYGADGRLAEVVSKPGTTTYGYLGGRLTVVSSGSATRTFGYDSSGAVASSTGIDGGRWALSSTEVVPPRKARSEDDARSFSVVGPGGIARTYGFEGNVLVRAEDKSCGVLLERTVRDGMVMAESRPADGVHMTRRIDGRLQYTQVRSGAPPTTALMTIDQRGRVVRAESDEGTTEVAYDGDSARPSSVTSNGHVTELRYNQRGLLMGSVDPDGYRVSVRRNRQGLPVTMTDGTVTTAFEYDDSGHTIEEVSGDASTTALYRADGLVESITDRSGRTLSAAYDANGALTKLGNGPRDAATPQDPNGYRCPDRPVETAAVSRNPNGRTEYTYTTGDAAVFDRWGRTVQVTTSGRSSTRRYDRAGRLVALTVPGGTSYHLGYTDGGRLNKIDDGRTKATLEWHGNLLTRLRTSGGSDYHYGYDPQGRLSHASAGSLTWGYRYDAAGQISEVKAPSGVTRYEWDENGRPEATVDGAHRETYQWSGALLDLAAMKIGDEKTVELLRDDAGRVTKSTTPDGEATFSYDGQGRVRTFSVPDGKEVGVEYGQDGRVASLTSDGRTERWTWTGGKVTSVNVDGEDVPYLLEWAAPGVLGKVTHGTDVLMRTQADGAGRVTGVWRDDKPLATLTWARSGLTGATVGDWRFTAKRDAEGRPLSLSVGNDKAVWTYDDGALTSVAHGRDKVTYAYDEGRLSKTTRASGENDSTVTWDPTGSRPVSVVTPHGTATFAYDGSRVARIRTGSKTEPVTYEAEGASAPGDAGKLLDDLFDETGRFERGSAHPSDGPASPWVDTLPAELGLALPDVITGSDLARGALDAAFPDTPTALLDDPQRVAERAVSHTVALGAATSVPVAPGRYVSLTPDTTKGELGVTLASFAGVRVTDSVNRHLAPGPSLLDRITDVGENFVGTIANGLGGGWDAVYGFITNTAFGRAALKSGFMALSALAGMACGTMVLCVSGVALGLALAQGYVSAGGVDGVLGAVVDSALQPYTDLRDSIVARNPVAIVIASVVAGGAVVGLTSSFWAKNYGPLALEQICRLKRLVCVSTSRYGEAAEHVVDAQRLGAPRLLRLDRTGAQARRASALRSVPARAGLDRDEYPFAVSSMRAGLSIRHIDPTSNRALGSYLGRQLRPLPDGARFYVLPLA